MERLLYICFQQYIKSLYKQNHLYSDLISFLPQKIFIMFFMISVSTFILNILPYNDLCSITCIINNLIIIEPSQN